MKRISLLAADVLFLASLVLVPLAWLLASFTLHFGPIHFTVRWHAAFVMVPPALLLLCAWFAFQPTRGSARGLLGNRWIQRISLAIAATFIFFLALEQVLEWIGYEKVVTPLVIEGTEKKEFPADKGIISDAELLWRFNPGAEFRGRRVNQLGFLDREINPVKAPGTIRVICMGDSVTGQGLPPYSGYLNAKLTNEPPTPQPWESFNMGVHGYSSVQGLRLFQLQGRQLQPDIVTLYFGWNDHWLGHRPDSKSLALFGSQFQWYLYKVLEHKRFGQLLIHTLHPERTYAAHMDVLECRVPADEYRKTLEQFVAEIRVVGAVPVLITTPRAERLSSRLVKYGQARSVEEAVNLHDQYVEITRDVARRNGVSLLDLRKKFSGADTAPLFQADGIHFHEPGLVRIAEELDAHLRDLTSGAEWKNRAGKTQIKLQDQLPKAPIQ